jgi:hypothetical protein
VSSPLTLPVQLPTAAGWQLTDYLELTISSPAAAGGTATATGPQLDGGELWLIDHMVCYCTASNTVLRLYGGQVTPAALLDGSSSGSFDVADWPAGLQLQPTRQLLAVWSNAADGARGTLTIQARRLRRVG